AVAQPQLADLPRREVRNVATRDGLVVMHDEGAVRRGMDVEFHGVGAQRPRRPERGERVLELAGRRAAVRDDERPRPPLTHLSRLSAFFGSIQPGSFSMSCTIW